MKKLFAHLPQGWEETNLGEITVDKVDQGLNIQRAVFTYIDISSIDNDLKEITEEKLIPTTKAPSRARQQVKNNDVLVSMTRPNLNAVAVVPENMENSIASTGFDVLRAIIVNPKWIFSHVRSQRFIQKMEELVQGALYPAVKSRDVRSYGILLPPLPEQNRIIKKLDALQLRRNKARKALEAILPSLEKLRQSVLASAFRGDLTADWRAQNPDIEPAEKLLERIRKERRKRWEEDELAKMKAKGKTPKDDKWKNKYKEPEPVDTTDLPELPAGWCWARVKELTELINGDRGKNYPNRNEYVADGIPFINTGHIEPDGSLSLKRMNYITRKKFDSLGSGKIAPGDLVYCLRGATLGKTARVDPFIEGAIASSLVIVRPVDLILTDYLYCFFVSPFGRDEIKKYDNGSAQPNLAAESVSQYLIPLAPEIEIENMVQLILQALRSRDKIWNFVKNSMELIINLDQSILSKAFRGELVPQDPKDEPACELLERIKQEKASFEAEKKQKGIVGKKKKITRKKRQLQWQRKKNDVHWLKSCNPMHPACPRKSCLARPVLTSIRWMNFMWS